jgi:hypothetical protein
MTEPTWTTDSFFATTRCGSAKSEIKVRGDFEDVASSVHLAGAGASRVLCVLTSITCCICSSVPAHSNAARGPPLRTTGDDVDAQTLRLVTHPRQTKGRPARCTGGNGLRWLNDGWSRSPRRDHALAPPQR